MRTLPALMLPGCDMGMNEDKQQEPKHRLNWEFPKLRPYHHCAGAVLPFWNKTITLARGPEQCGESEVNVPDTSSSYGTVTDEVS